MPSSLASPHFITHRELNRFLGERTRQRWEKDGLLPEPDWIRVDRHRIGIYPELVLARLVVGNTRDPIEQRTISKAMDKCERLTATDGYHRLRALVRSVFAGLQDKQDWNFATFVASLADQDHDVVEAWHAEVAEIEEELTKESSLSFSSLIGIVSEAAEDAYTVVLSSGEEKKIREALSALGLGTTVVLESVGVESRVREFVLPGLPVTEEKESAEELRLETEGDTMEQAFIDPLSHITVRSLPTAADLFELPAGAQMLSVREEFERGRISDLISSEGEAPYVEPEQVFSFAFDSQLLEASADVLV